VLAQSYARLELIVVDDSPGRAAAARLHGVDDARLRIVRTRDRGRHADAYNAGIDEARGQIICALDDDNVMHRNWLRSDRPLDGLHLRDIHRGPGSSTAQPLLVGVGPSDVLPAVHRLWHLKADRRDGRWLAGRDATPLDRVAYAASELRRWECDV
jgi:glycosyltransferase involved in cell wall biosynthesis